MKHADFTLGCEFWCNKRRWRCTDIGTRVIVAIRLDQVEIGGGGPGGSITYEEALAEGWFNGPPYPVAEIAFDEEAIEASTPA